MSIDPRQFLEGLFQAALTPVMAERCVPPFLPEPPKGRTLVIGAGKAAAAMAKAVEDHYKGDYRFRHCRDPLSARSSPQDDRMRRGGASRA